MPLARTALEQPPSTLTVEVDPRWTMAFAAGIPDTRPALYATDAPAGLVVHPLFPVAAEWQLITTARAAGTGLDRDEARRGIHVGHDLLLLAALPARATLELSVRTVAVDRRRSGATQTVEFSARHDGREVWRTRMTTLYLGVELAGDPASVAAPWPDDVAEAPGGELARATTEVRTVDAHVYSECARIWNPIHTDITAATAAGLQAPILHGTATLARAVSIAATLAEVPLDAIRRISGRFSGQVELGSTFDVRLLGRDDTTVWFDAVRPDGTPLLRSTSFTT